MAGVRIRKHRAGTAVGQSIVQRKDVAEEQRPVKRQIRRQHAGRTGNEERPAAHLREGGGLRPVGDLMRQ